MNEDSSIVFDAMINGRNRVMHKIAVLKAWDIEGQAVTEKIAELQRHLAYINNSIGNWMAEQVAA